MGNNNPQANKKTSCKSCFAVHLKAQDSTHCNLWVAEWRQRRLSRSWSVKASKAQGQTGGRLFWHCDLWANPKRPWKGGTASRGALVYPCSTSEFARYPTLAFLSFCTNCSPVALQSISPEHFVRALLSLLMSFPLVSHITVHMEVEWGYAVYWGCEAETDDFNLLLGF